ncbi:hypothetical protein E0H22_20975 [Rhodopseudomonas boonkerdii]|uniref:hypothetical protein n=1 Tax=Rhodopseudomonas boonkerdii TaxID=475937 RepID=UPI001E2A6D5D|nr:hypothetical protein [Rhodopseudomonas boonkerdii]UGV27932.1 hypothetical protein E0H22_20975 [Rhodopseudomonas boonkerdii]
MSGNVENAVLDILKKIQSDITLGRSELKTFKQDTETRFERLETLVRKQRRDGAAMLVMMRAAAGDFEERLTAVEQQIAALEARDH